MSVLLAGGGIRGGRVDRQPSDRIGNSNPLAPIDRPRRIWPPPSIPRRSGIPHNTDWHDTDGRPYELYRAAARFRDWSGLGRISRKGAQSRKELSDSSIFTLRLLRLCVGIPMWKNNRAKPARVRRAQPVRRFVTPRFSLSGQPRPAEVSASWIIWRSAASSPRASPGFGKSKSLHPHLFVRLPAAARDVRPEARRHRGSARRDRLHCVGAAWRARLRIVAADGADHGSSDGGAVDDASLRRARRRLCRQRHSNLHAGTGDAAARPLRPLAVHRFPLVDYLGARQAGGRCRAISRCRGC